MTTVRIRRLAPAFIAVLGIVAGALVASPAVASPPTHTITIHRNDLVKSISGSWLAGPALSPSTTEIDIDIPAAVQNLDISQLEVSVTPQSGSGSALVPVTDVVNDGSTIVLPVTSFPSSPPLQYAVHVRSASGSGDQVTLDYTSIGNFSSSAAVADFDFDPTEASFYGLHFNYVAPTLHVARGDGVVINGPSGLFTTSPDNDWTSVQSTLVRQNIDTTYVYADSAGTISSNGSQLSFSLTGRYAVDETSQFTELIHQQVTDNAFGDTLEIDIPLDYTGVASPIVTRIGGADRYAAAVNMADTEYGKSGSPVVWIATGTNYADALSAAPAAVHEGGPLLLTPPGSLPQVVAAEIVKLHPTKILIAGGTASISPTVATALGHLISGVTPVRIAGADRYDTSRKVISYAFVSQAGYTGVDHVYLATGSNFPDALSASAVAGRLGDPVLLVNGAASSADSATKSLLTSLQLHPNAPPWQMDGSAIVVGGTVSVSAAYQTSLQGLASLPDGINRVSGADRYETSRNVVLDGTQNAGQVYLATGSNFPDALAGAALAGSTGGPLFVINSTCVPTQVLTAIHEYRVTKVTLLGGAAALSESVASLTPCGSHG